LEEVTHGEHVDRDQASLAELTDGEIDSYEREQRYVRRDGTLLWGRLAVSVVRDVEGAPLYFVIQIEDITEFREAQAELEYRALYDPLTGLANRSLLMDRLANTLPISLRPGHVGIGFCDVDDFKQINDTHGHHAGDEVLKEIARRLLSAVRDGDTVARMGGDEFILLLTDVDSLLDAEGVMERATRAIAQPIMVDGVTLRVGLSRGLALSRSGVSADTLLRNADAALYAAKKNGRGGCVVYHPLLEGASDHLEEALARNDPSPAPVETTVLEYDRSHLEELIREALDNDRVRVAYQPVFDLSSGMIVGAEALLRLSDSAGRPVPPLQVIPAAEASGQIVEIGRRVLQLAAEQSARWRADHGVLLPIAVNVSAAQLNLPGFPAHVLDAVERAGVPPEALVIELTESVMLRTGSGGVQQLSELRDAGIELAIDDFGTGYASLSLLHELPAATLKIDQSFISGIPHDDRAVAIVAGVIELSQSLGMYCIAEGIETETQRAYLVEHGVLGQGYLLGRPDDDASISRILARDGMGDPWGRRAAHAASQAVIPVAVKNPAGA
jgi:diguanylate cyclase (GGDEF)-like protein